jgi:aminoglycoside phosphotransferase (APT) family kinase protein
MIEAGDIVGKLSAAGVAANVRKLESRKGRTIAHLDGGRIAWFPETPQGAASIAAERRILRLVETHCSFRAPRILHQDSEGWDLRSIVPGVPAPSYLQQVRTDPAAAQRMGEALGRILADQHAIPSIELSGWLGRIPPWPAPEDIANIPRVASNSVLLARIDRALDRRDAMQRELADPVLNHCDLGPWNLAVDPATGDLNGVFDYGDAFLGDRCHDFKYMQFYRPREQVMLEAAIAAYESETGLRLDRQRIRFFNAMEAIGFLGHRFGHAPEEDWCGRTLAEDLDWTNTALAAAGFP